VIVLYRGNDVGDREVTLVLVAWYSGSRLGVVQRYSGSWSVEARLWTRASLTVVVVCWWWFKVVGASSKRDSCKLRSSQNLFFIHLGNVFNANPNFCLPFQPW
jgi:hypothetical protein